MILMQKQEFKLRRDRLLQQIGSCGIAIIGTAKEFIRSGTEYYPYRPNSNFYYLTGFAEANALAVFIPGGKHGEFILFNRKRDPEKEIWNGALIGQEGACSVFGADQAFCISEIDQILPDLLIGRDKVYFDFGRDSGFDAKIISWIEQINTRVRDGVKFPCQIINVGEIVHEMRIKKSTEELKIMQKAADIAVAGHLRAMKNCQSGMYEYEVEAELIYEFKRLGGRYEAFNSIVAGGKNSCVLHYENNSEQLKDGELLLIDAGAEYKYYCSDVTRTFPVNRKFTKEQRAIYEAVLETQLAVIQQIRPGVRWNQLQLTADNVIAAKLNKLGLIDDVENKSAVRRFFMHKIGHWLGLDTHDVGKYFIGDDWRILEQGMVIAIEPGIYITPQSSAVDNKWWNIGVRIEDDILVTADGCEILTKNLPKEISEIEKVMRR